MKPNMITKLLTELSEGLEHQPGSETTQVSITTNTYKKIAEYIKPLQPHTVLDYGAGLGLSPGVMQPILGSRVRIDTYEPNPSRAKVAPTFTSSSSVRGPYDVVICLNVLNVLEPALRQRVLSHILKLVAPGGCAIIGTRAWTGDVNMAKSFTPAEEPHAIWIARGGTPVYQKGFDRSELRSYVQDHAGTQFTVVSITGIAKAAVVATRKD